MKGFLNGHSEEAVQSTIVQANNLLRIVHDTDTGDYTQAISKHVGRLTDLLEVEKMEPNDPTHQKMKTTIQNIAALCFMAEHDLMGEKKEHENNIVDISVTKHAIERMKKRLGIPKKACHLQAIRAYFEGKPYKRIDTNFRIYNNYIYVFKGTTLVTVYPSS